MRIDPWKEQGKDIYVHYRAGLVESNGNPVHVMARHAYVLSFDGKKIRLYESIETAQRKNVLGILSLEGEASRDQGCLVPLYGNCLFVNGKDRIVNGQRMFTLNEPIELKPKEHLGTVILVAATNRDSKLDDLIRMHNALAHAKYTPRRGRPQAF
jgi:hypothetical protein